MHNNAGGQDAQELERFDEPSWNNPVVRFLDGSGRDLIARQDRVWTEAGLAARMLAALRAAQQPVPPWFQLAFDELEPEAPARALLGMHCFWEGQGRLGLLEGVVDVRPVFVDGAEACEVLYRPERVDYAALLKTARAQECATSVWPLDETQRRVARDLPAGVVRELRAAAKRAPESDDLRSLRSDQALMLLPLTRAQRVRANGLLRAGRELSPAALTPRQVQLAAAMRQRLAADPKGFGSLSVPTLLQDLGGHEDRLRELVSLPR